MYGTERDMERDAGDYNGKDNKKKKVKYILIGTVIALFLILAFTGGSMILEYNSKGEGTGEPVEVTVLQGQGIWDIASVLKDEGLIRWRPVFYLKARNMGASSRLRYGTFSLRKGAGLENLIESLISGGARKESVMFTVPEGYSIEMIADKLEKEGICSGDEFLKAVKGNYDYWFLESIPDDADVKYRLQGFLFPDTYAVDEDTTPEDIVTMMLDQFNRKFSSDMKNKAETLGKTVYEVVTEASVIERETKISEEREIVAGVLKNRLDRDMLLQICSTALYPITGGMYNKSTVTYEDTQVDSPYNTYKYPGLPEGPIACPGLPSIKAALNPAVHEYLYFHTDNVKNDGSHIFTKTYDEHTGTQ